MARPLRLEFAGAFYHITTRGNARQDIFLGDDDRRAFLDLFADIADRFDWRCHGYCLMGNHYHLIVETPAPNLARGMRQLNGVYTQTFNHIHNREGHLFQGRYKAILVERDAYLLELARYVVLNPVRAGLVKRAGDWPWSSYQATAGEIPAPDWLETAWLLAQFGGRDDIAQKAWREFVADGVRPASEGAKVVIWDGLRQQLFLGSDRFVETMQARLKQESPGAAATMEIPRAQRRPSAKPLNWYAETYADRREAMARAWLSGDFSQAQIADLFNVHYSTVSRAARRFIAGG